MPIINIPETTTFEEWRLKTNLIAEQSGDLSALSTTDKSSLVAAMNELLGAVLGYVGSSWSVVTTNTSIVNHTNYMVDTLAGPITMVLPASPSFADTVILMDLSNTFNTNNCIVSRNGNLINGVSEDLIIDVSGVSVTLVYSGATQGWKVV